MKKRREPPPTCPECGAVGRPGSFCPKCSAPITDPLDVDGSLLELAELETAARERFPDLAARDLNAAADRVRRERKP